MQLEEFERAVKSSYIKSSSDDARDRHREFIVAIEEHILKIENSLKKSALSEGKTSLPWVRLDEGESNELALFLSGPTTTEDNANLTSHKTENENPQPMSKESSIDCSKSSSHSIEWGSAEARDEKTHGHRRTASANADIGAWKIVIADDGSQLNSFDGQAPRPPRKIPSLSGILSTLDSASKFNWPKNGARKWKATDRQQECDIAPLRSSQLTGVSS